MQIPTLRLYHYLSFLLNWSIDLSKVQSVGGTGAFTSFCFIATSMIGRCGLQVPLACGDSLLRSTKDPAEIYSQVLLFVAMQLVCPFVFSSSCTSFIMQERCCPIMAGTDSSWMHLSGFTLVSLSIGKLHLNYMIFQHWLGQEPGQSISWNMNASVVQIMSQMQLSNDGIEDYSVFLISTID